MTHYYKERVAKTKRYQQSLLVIASILTIVCMLIIPVNASSDTTAPQIKGFSINKNSINASDKVQVTVNITDDSSGVNMVRVFYYNPSRSQQLCAHLSETSSGIWQGNLEFDRYAEEGTYTLWEIIATDVAGNQVDIYDTKLPAEYASQKITVSNDTNSNTGNQGSGATKPTTGNQGNEATKPTTGSQGSETTKHSTGNQGSETTKPSTGNQGSENTAPTTGNQGGELTDSTNDNSDQSALYFGLFITLTIVIVCAIVVIVLKYKNNCRKKD